MLRTLECSLDAKAIRIPNYDNVMIIIIYYLSNYHIIFIQ